MDNWAKSPKGHPLFSGERDAGESVVCGDEHPALVPPCQAGEAPFSASPEGSSHFVSWIHPGSCIIPMQNLSWKIWWPSEIAGEVGGGGCANH